MVDMTKDQIEAVLQNVRQWPPEDQEELAETAREIAARRSGVYVMDDGERTAIAEARNSDLVSEARMNAFWKRCGVE